MKPQNHVWLCLSAIKRPHIDTVVFLYFGFFRMGTDSLGSNIYSLLVYSLTSTQVDNVV